MRHDTNLFIELVIHISPGIVRLHLELIGVQDGKAIVDVGAEVGINILRNVLPCSLPVPGPVGEVADDLVVVLPRPALLWGVGAGGVPLSGGGGWGGVAFLRPGRPLRSGGGGWMRGTVAGGFLFVFTGFYGRLHILAHILLMLLLYL